MKAQSEFKTIVEYKEYLRTYFAAMAMQGLLANPEWMKIYEGEKYLMMADTMATVSVERADSLLSELDKTESK